MVVLVTIDHVASSAMDALYLRVIFGRRTMQNLVIHTSTWLASWPKRHVNMQVGDMRRNVGRVDEVYALLSCLHQMQG